MKEKEQTSEPDTDMAVMLVLSDHEFKIFMINMLKVLMDKLNSIQEQMVSVSRKMEILRKNKTARDQNQHNQHKK